MEFILKNITVHDKECTGCKNHKKDVMFSFMAEETKNEIHDIFLTNEQAKELVEKVNKSIEYNI